MKRVSGGHYGFSHNPNLELTPRTLNDIQGLGRLLIINTEQLPAIPRELRPRWEEWLILNKFPETTWDALKLIPPNGEKPISLMSTMSILSRRTAPLDNLILPTLKGCPDMDMNQCL
jgi:hypothetical protein